MQVGRSNLSSRGRPASRVWVDDGRMAEPHSLSGTARVPEVNKPVDAAVALICESYLELGDRYVPGLVEGLYLQGSIALGDYRPGVSDIDFVAVTSRPPHIDRLRLLHAELHRQHRKPFFDGLYVSREDLRSNPDTLPFGVSVHERRVDATSRFERNLVTWHVLAQAGVAVCGPAVAGLGVYTDWPALAQATHRNLDEYWSPWVERTARSPLGLKASTVAWGVLGIARLRHTLAAGRVTSKTEAAAYATTAYDPRWNRIVQEALRIRVGGPAHYRNLWRRRTDLIGFVREALDA